MYSLILTDIDGTLLQDNLSISQNTISALRKAKNNGLRIVLSSGRYLHGIQFLKDEIGIDDIILFVPQDCALICLFGKISTEKIADIIEMNK